MKLLACALVIAAISPELHSTQPYQRATGGQIHAVIVSGSKGWVNYRHEADACHAYHTLRRHGVLPENIILMVYDDIADSPINPYPGKMFNQPHGEDVYKGVKIDYTKDSVTPQNFLNILKGNASAVKGGNGKVLRSNSNDRVFVYFVDHGAVGLLGFPNGVLTVKELSETLNWMHQNERYGELVFYLEACFSGSMFRDTLTADINVYAVTAADHDEYAYATYCDTGMSMKLPCIGDEFSAGWMENSDENDINRESLEEQFWSARNRTYYSHVMRYGNLQIAEKPVGWFHGEERLLRSRKQHANSDSNGRGSWPAYDVELLYLRQLKESTNSVLETKQIDQRISKIQDDRRQIELLFTRLVEKVLNDGGDRRQMLEEHTPISNLDCHDEVVRTFHSICINFSKFDYALKYVNVLNNLCTHTGNAGAIVDAMRVTCSTTHSRFL